nr:50S ribosomal protein L2 [Candidatus Sarmatiella mevalonica]
MKNFRPTTPSQRELVSVDRSLLWKGKPEKSLARGLLKSGGRNNTGRITSRCRGGGHKRLYRLIDFKRTARPNEEAVVERLEYDPNRTAFIALLKFQDGALSYILAPDGLQVGESVMFSSDAEVKPGNCLPLANIPVGTIIHNIEMKPGKGGQIARSAGAFAKLAGKDSGFARIKLQSGEMRLVPVQCVATIGVVSNADHKNIKLGKAGRSRWLGRRPHVRGVAMNPVDHPHGGGEGKTSGGRHPVTPWGIATKGKKTRKNKRTSRFIIKK